jgi:hypothetical protein
MKRIRCSELEPGMVLSEDVFGHNGEMLMPIGAQLTERSIHLLQIREVPSVAIEGDEEDPFKNFPADKVTAIEQEIRNKFINYPENDLAFSELVKLCIIRKIERNPKEEKLMKEPEEKSEDSPEKEEKQ